MSRHWQPLTVGFAEPGFLAGLKAEHAGILMKGFFDRDATPSTGPANPQALNRYAYVLNNPVRYTDPTGHNAEVAELLLKAALVVAAGGATTIAGVPIAVIVAAVVSAGLVIACVEAQCWNGIIDLTNQGQMAAAELTDEIEILIVFANKADIKLIKYIAKKYGLTREQRRELHDTITGQNYSNQEIEDEAKAIKEREEAHKRDSEK